MSVEPDAADDGGGGGMVGMIGSEEGMVGWDGSYRWENEYWLSCGSSLRVCWRRKIWEISWRVNGIERGRGRVDEV